MLAGNYASPWHTSSVANVGSIFGVDVRGGAAVSDDEGNMRASHGIRCLEGYCAARFSQDARHYGGVVASTVMSDLHMRSRELDQQFCIGRLGH